MFESEGSTPNNIERVFPDRVIGIADASELSSMPEVGNSWDMLVVNLPHRAIEMLPSLTPLLDKESPSLVRGRIVVAETEIQDTIKKIAEILPPLHPDIPSVNLTVKRDYSSTLRLCSFEAWLAPLT